MDNIILGIKVTEWLAIIGALSWIPILGKWVYDFISKPKMTIISGRQIELGFTTNGPIINLSLAFLSEKKKALITNIDLELIHENNDTQKFSWRWFEEVLYKMDIPNAGQISTKKNQNAIAIKIGLDELIEKRVGFQQNTFRNEYDKQYKLLIEDSINFSQLGKNLNDLKVIPSYTVMRDLLSNSFNWKVGKYTVKIKAYLSGDNITANHEFSFTLNSLEVKLMHSNIDICHKTQEQTFVDETITIDEPWQWVYTDKLIE
jgi:hypothetical protein